LRVYYNWCLPSAKTGSSMSPVSFKSPSLHEETPG
jgi:hypothetical protein